LDYEVEPQLKLLDFGLVEEAKSEDQAYEYMISNLKNELHWMSRIPAE